ncbi:aminoacyl-tRNA hydrolase [Amphibacillus sp. MSJ-3]|uniref:aminoacyl-tRNA hydrolase n=1 Tax=Amphibacillus sp. MSJ-3 TaxID=2841505 RepID=UPI001C0E9887|nr:aminoacyl-tRNA hydrolase [Amphibacillus sp. MSJ-3]MBU5595548.1 aminoacyl-tRNA hydrolase [Amphibacillus sp. MSJ-3]
MKCIVGLGNPGQKYRQTRHNIGFMVIDELLKRQGWSLDKKKFNGHYAMDFIGGEKVILLQPQTYMNLSGDSVKPLMDFYQINPDELLVIYDDLDLPSGKIRLRQTGGHGGHNGMRSIIGAIGTNDFNRIRIGIDRPNPNMTVIDYVLGRFSKDEEGKVRESIQRSAAACEMWLEKPFLEVMNEYN